MNCAFRHIQYIIIISPESFKISIKWFMDYLANKQIKLTSKGEGKMFNKDFIQSFSVQNFCW